MIVQITLSVFLLFALSRVLMQVRSAKITIGGFLFWTSLFIFALVGVLDPNLTTSAARWFGIGRGVDAVLYISVALLFYLIFRLSISLEETKREISELTRKIALGEPQFNNKSKRKRKTK